MRKINEEKKLLTALENCKAVIVLCNDDIAEMEEKVKDTIGRNNVVIAAMKTKMEMLSIRLEEMKNKQGEIF